MPCRKNFLLTWTTWMRVNDPLPPPPKPPLVSTADTNWYKLQDATFSHGGEANFAHVSSSRPLDIWVWEDIWDFNFLDYKDIRDLVCFLFNLNRLHHRRASPLRIVVSARHLAECSMVAAFPPRRWWSNSEDVPHPQSWWSVSHRLRLRSGRLAC